MTDQAKEEFVKIVIDLPEAEDGVGGEGVWSVKVGDDLYEVRNSPWHTLDINYLDVVRAVAPDENKIPLFQRSFAAEDIDRFMSSSLTTGSIKKKRFLHT